MLRLLPFSIEEVSSIRPPMPIDEMLVDGFYPRIHHQNLVPAQALSSYFETYVERDVRLLGGVRDLSTFQRFVRLCAGRVGQLLNLQSLGNDTGISHTTARQWMSVLEASFIVFLLPPLHANVSKRLIKTPKLYFHDVGLASWLLGIEHTGHMPTHPLRGPLFENLVVSELVKHRFNTARTNTLSFYRDSSGLEVDVVYPSANQLIPIEIKAGQTVSPSQLQSLERFRGLLPAAVTSPLLVHGGDEELARGAIQTLPVHRLIPMIRNLEDR